jgi:hypothetical protein
MSDPNKLSRRGFLQLATVAGGAVVLSPLLKACQRMGINATTTDTPVPTRVPPTVTQVPSSPTATRGPTATETLIPKYSVEELTAPASSVKDIVSTCSDPRDDLAGCRRQIREAASLIVKESLPGLPESRFLKRKHISIGTDYLVLSPSSPIEPAMRVRTPRGLVILGMPFQNDDGSREVIPTALIPDPKYADDDLMIRSVEGRLAFMGTGAKVPDSKNARWTIGVVSPKGAGSATVFSDKFEMLQADSVLTVREGLRGWLQQGKGNIGKIVGDVLLTGASIQKK